MEARSLEPASDLVAPGSLDVWREPVRGEPGDPALLGLSGLEVMRAAVRGQIARPPIHHLTGLRPVEASPAAATFVMPATPWLLSPPGVYSAGVVAWLADAPLGTAVFTTLPAGKANVTSDLSMSFLRPASPSSGRLIGRARLVHAGRSLGLSEVHVEDGDGRVLAHGTTRMFIFDAISPAPEPPELPDRWAPRSYDTPDPYLRPAVGAAVPQEVWDRCSGLDVTRMLMSGELAPPPIHHLMGMRTVEAEEGSVTMQMPASGWLMSPAGMVYGGALALFADFALTVAVGTTVPPGTAHSPLDLKVNFLRPAFCDGRDLVARATVTHRGKSMAVSTTEILNADAKRVAVGTSSSLILPGRPWTGESRVVPADDAPDADPGADS